MTGEGKAGVYLRRTGLARPKPPGMALALALCGAVRADAPPPVSTFDLGRFTLLVDPTPLRLAWRDGRSPLLAERARRWTSSIEAFTAGRWRSFGRATSARAEGGKATVTAECTALGRPATLEASTAGTGDLIEAILRIDAAGAEAVRDDFILAPDESLLLFPGEKTLVISSRGRGVLVEAWSKDGSPAATAASRPDPDSFRLEGKGPILRCRIWLGTPKELLRRRVRIDPKPFEIDLAARSAAFAGVRESLEAVFASLAPRASEEGIGAVRPLAVEHPREAEAWTVEDEWLVGPGVLVALPHASDTPRRDVWLPPGRWRDARKPGAEPVTGPARIAVGAEPAGALIFIEEGSEKK